MEMRAIKVFAAWTILLAGPPPGTCAEVSAVREGEEYVLRWHGDEDIRVSLPVKGGLLHRQIVFQVDGKRLAFNGFSASMNGSPREGWEVISEESRLEGGRVIIAQRLRHPDLERPTEAGFQVWMTPRDKVVRFQIALEGQGQHLDYLGVGEHSGKGLACKRLYFGSCVINGPLKPFETKRLANRYWTMELENGLTEMQGMDLVPMGFVFTPGDSSAVYDMHTYCSSPVTYTFVVTAKGAQEAIRQYSQSLPYRPTRALEKLPGRSTVMLGYPLKDNLEWWYREFTGRGARDLIWLSYIDWPNDEQRQILAESNSLYCPYTCYTGYFDPQCDLSEGQLPSPDWAPENCMYDEKGNLIREYHKTTILLPNLYTKWADQGKMQKQFYNLKDYRDIMRASAFFFDVHARIPPAHYFDYKGKHYSQREFLKHTSDLFEVARKYGEDGPVFSNCGRGGEWFAGAMEGGSFNRVFSPDFWGINGSDWEYYPNVDQVHRRHYLSVAATRDYGEKEWNNRKAMFQQQVALKVFYGRSENIVCYWATDISRMDTRLMSYYLHSGFHRMLGTQGIREVAFADGDVHRPVVHYEHGATVWVNRRDDDWVVEGRRLKEACYLIKGPDFLQYCEVPEGKDYSVEFVRSPDYWLFASPHMNDFGPAKINGAYAVRVPARNSIVVYQVNRTLDVITLRLPDILGRPGPYKLKAAYTVFDGQRVKRDAQYEKRPSKIENDFLIFEPSQDPHAWRYEIEVE